MAMFPLWSTLMLCRPLSTAIITYLREPRLAQNMPRVVFLLRGRRRQRTATEQERQRGAAKDSSWGTLTLERREGGGR